MADVELRAAPSSMVRLLLLALSMVKALSQNGYTERRKESLSVSSSSVTGTNFSVLNVRLKGAAFPPVPRVMSVCCISNSLHLVLGDLSQTASNVLH
jgi:hypothetical protein